MDLLDELADFIVWTQGRPVLHPELLKRAKESDGSFTRNVIGVAHIGRDTIRPSNQIRIILYFDLIDMIIDSIFPDYYGKEFSKKYNYISSESSFLYIVIGQIFRVMMLLRNSLIHNRNCIRFLYSVDGINDSKFFMQVEADDLIIFKSSMHNFDIIMMIIFIIYNNHKSENYYMIGMISSLYNELIRSSDFEIKDKYGKKLRETSHKINFFSKVRYRNLTDDFINTGERLIFGEGVGSFLHHDERSYSGVDHVFSFSGKNYIIPQEALTEDMEIALCELDKWERPGKDFNFLEL